MYKIVEIDAGDKTHDVRIGLSRSEAKAKLNILRETYGKYGLRYIMVKEG